MRNAIALLAAFILSPLCHGSDGVFNFQKTTLGNGLRVIVHEDHAVPLAHIYIWYQVGSKDEDPNLTGFAHLFEHLMFKGSKHVPDATFPMIVQSLGGKLNASTSWDRTDYFVMIDPSHLEEIFRIESDRMGFLQGSLTKKVFETERDVVKEEKNQSEDEEHGQLDNVLVDTIFDQGHPYKWPIIGSMDHLNKATVEDVRAFFAKHYMPNNAVLVVSGDVDASRVFELAKRWFGPIPAGVLPPKTKMPAFAKLDGRREVVVADARATMPKTHLAFRVPGDGQPGFMELDIVGEILANGRGSRLVRSLQYEKRMVAQISAGMVGTHEGDVLVFTFVPMPGVASAEVEEAVRAEISKIAQNGVTAREVERVKAMARTARLNALQSLSNISGALGGGEARFNDPAEAEKSFEALMNIQPEALQNAASEYLTPSNSAVIIGVPKGTAGAVPSKGAAQ